jgi:hypothetical protein
MFGLSEPSDRFINFASFDTGVLAFECVFSSLMSDALYVLRVGFFFVVFFTTSIFCDSKGGLISRSQSSSRDRKRAFRAALGDFLAC